MCIAYLAQHLQHKYSSRTAFEDKDKRALNLSPHSECQVFEHPRFVHVISYLYARCLSIHRNSEGNPCAGGILGLGGGGVRKEATAPVRKEIGILLYQINHLTQW